MMRILLFSFCCLFFALTISGQQKRKEIERCQDSARTQPDLNNCARLAFTRADAELNKEYQRLMKSQSADEEYQKKLKEAQLTWLKYRDANCESEAAQYRGGSIYPSVYDYCLASVTEERTGRIREMLKNLEM